MGVWLLRRDLSPFIGLLVASDALVRWVSLNFDDNC